MKRREMYRNVLMAASVASMIQQFNLDNLVLLQELGYKVQCFPGSETAAVFPRPGDCLAPVGLPAEHPAVWKLREGLPADPGAFAAVSVCVDALPFADRRCVGQDSGA